MTLTWSRPRKDQLPTGTVRRRWLSRCKAFAIEEHRNTGLPTVYLALRIDGGAAGIILSRHRTRRAAERACATAANSGGPRPCPSTRRKPAE